MSESDKPDSPEENAPAEAEASSEEAQAEEQALVQADAQSEDELAVSEAAAEEEVAAGRVGVERYVHAAFFTAGILAAYLSGKILLSVWNTLAEWQDVTRAVPFLINYGEEDRASMTLVIGAVVGVVLVLRYYRRPAVRSWATQVASELARVTWPSKETVTNGTIVVLIAGAIATLYVALLDRLWGYLTNLIYGA